MFGTALGQRMTAETDNTQLSVVETRRSATARKSHPDFTRNLRRHAMKYESGKKTNRRMGQPFANFRKRVIFRNWGVGNAVKAPASSFDESAAQ